MSKKKCVCNIYYYSPLLAMDDEPLAKNSYYDAATSTALALATVVAVKTQADDDMSRYVQTARDWLLLFCIFLPLLARVDDVLEAFAQLNTLFVVVALLLVTYMTTSCLHALSSL